MFLLSSRLQRINISKSVTALFDELAFKMYLTWSPEDRRGQVRTGEDRRDVTSSEHQGTFAVVTVVVVLVSGAETGPMGDQAALPPCCTAVTSQIQPE